MTRPLPRGEGNVAQRVGEGWTAERSPVSYVWLSIVTEMPLIRKWDCPRYLLRRLLKRRCENRDCPHFHILPDGVKTGLSPFPSSLPTPVSPEASSLITAHCGARNPSRRMSQTLVAETAPRPPNRSILATPRTCALVAQPLHFIDRGTHPRSNDGFCFEHCRIARFKRAAGQRALARYRAVGVAPRTSGSIEPPLARISHRRLGARHVHGVGRLVHDAVRPSRFACEPHALRIPTCSASSLASRWASRQSR